MNICSIDGCYGRHEAKGFCIKHYERFRTHGDPLKSLHIKFCKMEGCKEKHKSRGYCIRHYERLVRGTLYKKSVYELSNKDRLLSKISINENNCWEWQGSKIKDNYGMIVLNGVRYLTHRLSYKLFFGEFDIDLCVCHKCDNPSCINPEHLFLGTHEENMADMKNKGRAYSPSKNKEKTA